MGIKLGARGIWRSETNQDTRIEEVVLTSVDSSGTLSVENQENHPRALDKIHEKNNNAWPLVDPNTVTVVCSGASRNCIFVLPGTKRGRRGIAFTFGTELDIPVGSQVPQILFKPHFDVCIPITRRIIPSW